MDRDDEDAALANQQEQERQQMSQSIEVYKAINAVQAALSKVGISKDHRNTQGAGYNFRGIDDVYNALAPLLAEHGLCILPRVLSRELVERTSQKGGALFYVTIEAEFDFVSAKDGSKHTVKTYGEAMDSGDKATNKAMSAAYKYAAFQAFSIPTEGDNDADASTHMVAAKPKKGVIKPTDGPYEALTADARATADAIIDAIQQAYIGGDDWKIREEMDGLASDAELKIAVWSKLDSKTRSHIKKLSEENKE